MFRISVLVALALVLTANACSSVREHLLIDADWRFKLDDADGMSDTQSVRQWEWKMAGPDLPATDEAVLRGLTGSGGWGKAAAKQDVFGEKKGFAWFRARLPVVKGPGRVLQVTAADDNAWVFLNGKKLLEHKGWNDSFEVPLDAAWSEGSPNVVLILLENTGGPGNVGEAEVWSPTGEQAAPTGPALPGFDDRPWRQLGLPHDFVVEGTFDRKASTSHGFLPKGVGWYRKHFDLPASDKGRSIWVQFDGVYRNSQVWLNGQRLGKHLSGYTPFRFDISKQANYGAENVLSVRVDARDNEGWWYDGGGIYRHVWLNKSDPLRVAPDGTYVVSTPQGKGASLTLRTTLQNGRQSRAALSLHSQVLDPEGKIVLTLSSPSMLSPGVSAELKQEGTLASAQLWDLKSPRLYRLVSSLEEGGKVIDQVETTFGIRSIRFDANKGFFLNNKPVKIKGTCNHQDHAGLGIALPDRIFGYRLEKLKAMGSNAYRTAHHPHASELMDACDRLGMLVMDETRHLGDSKLVLEEVEAMVLRDRNHPSVILWSLCNEEGRQGSAEGRRLGEAMKKRILKLDQSRPISAAMNGGYGGEGLSNVIDVQGFNYHILDYDIHHKKYPLQPLLGSETASAVGTRGEYVTDGERSVVSAYDVNSPNWAQTAEAAWRPLAERPFMVGGFVWTGFDYRGEPTPYGWPCINSHFGIMDTCGFPKDSYAYYQSWWGDKPVLHLFPAWEAPLDPKRQVNVWAYSNHEHVELLVNGSSLGVKEVPKYGHVEWQAWYAPGSITARAFAGGKVVAETSVYTAGKAQAIVLKPSAQDLKPDGQDVIPVEVSVVDAAGRVVHGAAQDIRFSLRGPAEIAGVGNGDPTSHEPDKASKRKAFHGRCAVFVRGGSQAGGVELIAEATGLKTASIQLRK